MPQLLRISLWSLLCSACFCSSFVMAKEQHYRLILDYKTVNFSGKPAQAMAINDSIPGPVLRFTEGDTAVITVNNQLDTDASIHWHGLLLPQDQDGVPYLTYMPIKAGQQFTYRFPITHAGSYWYHSHTNIDEQRGQYGAIVISPKTPRDLDYDYDQVVQLSDWTDTDPVKVFNNLKKDGEWYAAEKGSLVGVIGYIKRQALSVWLDNREMGMNGMDVSDVAYAAFLANGQQHLKLLPQAQAGDKIRLRLINSAASSLFDIQQTVALTVIATDGEDVQPVVVKSLRMGMGETYDVIVTVPASHALLLHANSIDGTGYASIQIGSGVPEAAPLPQKVDLYAPMHHSHAHMKSQDTHQKLRYDLLTSLEPHQYQPASRIVTLDLTGDMDTYNWSFNNVPLSQADKILISRDEVVRFVFKNTTMMNHPLHLHGHFFKVLSGNGDHDVLKHTVNVGPMETVTIEFEANAEKDWFFHCHNLYHAKAGMARVVRYDDYSGKPSFMKAKAKAKELTDSHWTWRNSVGLATSRADLNTALYNTRYYFGLDIEQRDWQDSESVATIGFNLSPKTRLLMAAKHTSKEGSEARFGITTRLPYLLESSLWLNDETDIHASVETRVPVTEKLAWFVEADTEGDWQTYLAYRGFGQIKYTLEAASDMDVGIGVRLMF